MQEDLPFLMNVRSCAVFHRQKSNNQVRMILFFIHFARNLK